MWTRRSPALLGLAVWFVVAAGAGCASAYGAAGFNVGPVYSGHAGSAHRFSYGPIFRVGRYPYRIAYGGPAGGYYFRTSYLRGSRRCSRYCTSRDGYHYHHRSCPHLSSYLRHYGHRADVLIEHYAPSHY